MIQTQGNNTVITVNANKLKPFKDHPYQVNANEDMDRLVESIKEKGVLAGVAINPATPVWQILPILEKVDMVLIMSVNPGFGGQKMIPYTIEKVRELKKIIDENGYEVDIEVDGGATPDNVKMLLEAGANVIVAGSAVFGDHITEQVEKFHKAFEEV